MGVGSATFELNSYLDPWQLGLVTLFSVGYKQAPRPAGPLGGQRSPQEFSLGCKAATPGPLEQPTSHDVDRAEPEASRHLSLPIKEKINIWDFSFTCIMSILERQLGGWLRLVGRGTIPAGPRELTAHPSLWVNCQSAKPQVGG